MSGFTVKNYTYLIKTDMLHLLLNAYTDGM